MNDKQSKAPILIALLVALLLVAAGGYYFMRGPSEPPAPAPTPVATPGTTPSVTAPPVAAPPTPAPAAETIKCELCHTNSQELKPHVEGGKLCINCHGSQVHNIHIGPGTVGLNCDTCHGFPPIIPKVAAGEGPGHLSVCENCHGPPPESLKPSLGNLVTIHLSRAKYCTNCHGTDIAAIHAAALGQQ